MALLITAMNLADGNDPIDPVFAKASTSLQLDHKALSNRREAAEARATARFSLQGKAAISMSI